MPNTPAGSSGPALLLLGTVSNRAENASLTVRPEDTGAALVNPGMGWTMHFYSNIPQNYGSKLEPSDTLEDFPGLSTAYLRVPWAFLEPEEGRFNWALLDTPAQRWIARGKRVAFRVTCSENWMRFATPEWVDAKPRAALWKRCLIYLLTCMSLPVSPATMNPTSCKGLRLSLCGLLLLLAADLQAQLLYKTQFSAVEGYTNGWMIGQPSGGANKWQNANADWDWVYANEPSPETYSPLNNGKSWVPEGATEPFYIVTATNTAAPGGGQMKIASDGNYGTNAQTYFWKMDFPKQMNGPITVTWDWKFLCTNEIPADYDPTNNNYNSVLPGYDTGFTLSDYANCTADGGTGNPNWVYSELGMPVRLSSVQDTRYNPLGACGGGGNWNNY